MTDRLRGILLIMIVVLVAYDCIRLYKSDHAVPPATETLPPVINIPIPVQPPPEIVKPATTAEAPQAARVELPSEPVARSNDTPPPKVVIRYNPSLKKYGWSPCKELSLVFDHSATKQGAIDAAWNQYEYQQANADWRELVEPAAKAQ